MPQTHQFLAQIQTIFFNVASYGCKTIGELFYLKSKAWKKIFSISIVDFQRNFLENISKLWKVWKIY